MSRYEARPTRPHPTIRKKKLAASTSRSIAKRKKPISAKKRR
jgi:hypothetical protein